MKSAILIGLLATFAAANVNAARGPKERQATPVFEDQPNQSETFSVLVGTASSVKLYSPRQTSAPIEERKVIIQNMSGNRNLNITTWSVPTSEIVQSTAANKPSFVIKSSSQIPSTYEFPAGVTYYGRMDRGDIGTVTDATTGASSDVVHGIIHSFNQSLKP